MMNNPEFQWKLRFLNYEKVLKELREAGKIVASFLTTENNGLQGGEDTMFRFMQQGLIDNFGIAFETAWKVMKDYVVSHGHSDVLSVEETIREGHLMGLIPSENMWKEMLHTTRQMTGIEEEKVHHLTSGIIADYIPVLDEFRKKMQGYITSGKG